MKKLLFFIAILTFQTITFATGSNHRANTPPSNRALESANLNNSTRYCFHFTWMGGNFNNRTFKNIMNKTCNQYFKDKKTLCINPMVASYMGGEPDLKYILQNHPISATCRLLQHQVCAKYTVYQNSIVSYTTRYCTEININLEGPMQSGCIRDKKGIIVTEVCACASEPGPDGICNSGSRFISNLLAFLCAIIAALWLQVHKVFLLNFF